MSRRFKESRQECLKRDALLVRGHAPQARRHAPHGQRRDGDDGLAVRVSSRPPPSLRLQVGEIDGGGRTLHALPVLTCREEGRRKRGGRERKEEEGGREEEEGRKEEGARGRKGGEITELSSWYSASPPGGEASALRYLRRLM